MPGMVSRRVEAPQPLAANRIEIIVVRAEHDGVAVHLVNDSVCTVVVLIGMTTRDSMNDASTRTIAYLRVSTEKQSDYSASLDAQRAKAEAYAGLYALELVDVVVDAGASAKSLNRAQMRKNEDAHILAVA